MPRILCPKCHRQLSSFHGSYYCSDCELKVVKPEKRLKRPGVTQEDREFLKKLRVKWD
jgi:hypothetical protein